MARLCARKAGASLGGLAQNWLGPPMRQTRIFPYSARLRGSFTRFSKIRRSTLSINMSKGHCKAAAL